MRSIGAKAIVIVLTALVFIVVGVYFGFKKFYFAKEEIKSPVENSVKPESEKPSSFVVKPPAPKSELFPGFKLYKNSEFGFEIQIPDSWTVTEEINENVRGEMVKEFFFRSTDSDLRFAILPRDGLSYGLTTNGTSTQAYIGGSSGVQIKYILEDGRRLWLLFPQYRRYNWLEDIGRLDIMTSAINPAGDTRIFEQMLGSFKLLNN